MAKALPPLKSAVKSEWVAWAMNAHGLASFDAWGMTVEELHELAGADPAPVVEPGIPVITLDGPVFDPAAHTVAAVVEHLELADPDERARVVTLEAAGPARRGVLRAAARLDAGDPAGGADDPEGND